MDAATIKIFKMSFSFLFMPEYLRQLHCFLCSAFPFSDCGDYRQLIHDAEGDKRQLRRNDKQLRQERFEEDFHFRKA